MSDAPQMIDCPQCDEPAARLRIGGTDCAPKWEYACSCCGFRGEEPALNRQHRLVLERRQRIRAQLQDMPKALGAEDIQREMLRHALEEQVFWLDSLDIVFTTLRQLKAWVQAGPR